MASGSDIVQTAKRHLGERYVLGSVADYANPNFTGPWDCAEFASWCLYRVSQIHFGARAEGAGWNAHTGFWAEDARNAHAAIRCQEAAIVAGAFLDTAKSRWTERYSHLAPDNPRLAVEQAVGRLPRSNKWMHLDLPICKAYAN